MMGLQWTDNDAMQLSLVWWFILDKQTEQDRMIVMAIQAKIYLINELAFFNKTNWTEIPQKSGYIALNT